MKKFLILLVGLIVFSGLAYGSYHLYEAYKYDQISFTNDLWEEKFLITLGVNPIFIDKETVFDVPPPPKNSSRETQKELAFLHEIQIHQEKEKDKIFFEADPSVSTIDMMYEGKILPEEYWQSEALKTMLTKVYFHTSRYFIMYQKKKYNRPRPSQLDPSLKLLIKNPGHAAYPSGHSTESHMIAYLLGPLFPGYYDELLDYAHKIAHRREIAGVHYPSDSEAGRILARQIVDKLHENPEFRALYTAAWKDIQNIRHKN